tara:strand:- start:1299 stop:1487 length:189 start_codon:yes stop_codon:yes gene_type:complete
MRKQRFLGGNPAEILRCESCNHVLNEKITLEEKLCRHCQTKEQFGISDLATCFQGSVITLED